MYSYRGVVLGDEKWALLIADELRSACDHDVTQERNLSDLGRVKERIREEQPHYVLLPSNATDVGEEIRNMGEKLGRKIWIFVITSEKPNGGEMFDGIFSPAQLHILKERMEHIPHHERLAMCPPDRMPQMPLRHGRYVGVDH